MVKKSTDSLPPMRVGVLKKVAAKKVSKGREPRFYPADDVKVPLASHRVKRAARRSARLRASITPGTVLILLSGRFRASASYSSSSLSRVRSS